MVEIETHLKLKICGISDLAILEALVERNINYIGMIFAESPRKVSVEMLEQWVLHAPDYRLISPDTEFVGVFLDHRFEDLLAVLERFPFDRLQLHGDESVGYCKKIKREHPTIKIIKTLSIPVDVIDEAAVMQHLQSQISYYRNSVDGFLFDSSKGKQRGGTGECFPWDMIIPFSNNEFRDYEIGIAGGLNSDNIGQLLQIVRPDFIDVNSGVEVNGQKDTTLIDQLLKQLEEYRYESY